MDTLARDIGDDDDLDELMARVREVALGTGAGASAAAPAQALDDTAGRDSDFIRVIDAQNQWNEHTRRALSELVECLRTLRDDWGEAQKGMRDEMGRLSALVRRTNTSRRTDRVRHATKGRKRQS